MSVLIIGAGSMGLVSGYYLQLSNVEVTFLVRPHHKKDLDRPQILYDLSDNTVKHYTGYTYFTDPSQILGKDYDFIIITLDRTGLQNEEGIQLVKTIGKAVKGKSTQIILGTVTIGVRSWFLEISGISSEKVTNGSLGVMAYPPKSVSLPIYSDDIDREVLARSDVAYARTFGYTFSVADSSAKVARDFAALYERSGLTKCAVEDSLEYASIHDPIFVLFAGFELLGWSKLKDVDVTSDLWKLTTAAVKEAQGLEIHGKFGRDLADKTTEEGLVDLFAGVEKNTLPLDIQEFNRYHHGGKVNAQDRVHLAEVIKEGEREGRDVSKLKELVAKLPKK